jgi:glycosyltransferase involved in cell wall biosynthesis
MRLCLNMIVRDEAPVIERCIRSVLPHIQCWAIVDTGSSDGTQAIVRGLLGACPAS